VSILFVLFAITHETHLVILEGEGASVPWQISSLGASGISPMLLPLIDIDHNELQRRGEGEFSI
jgi:hypothetical protein